MSGILRNELQVVGMCLGVSFVPVKPFTRLQHKQYQQKQEIGKGHDDCVIDSGPCEK